METFQLKRVANVEQAIDSHRLPLAVNRMARRSASSREARRCSI